MAVPTTMPGARIDYVELPSATGHELTRGFYAKAFGWAFTDYGPDYSATTNGTTDVGLNGQEQEALAAFKKAVEADPRSVPAYLALANLYWAARKPVETASALQQATVARSAIASSVRTSSASMRRSRVKSLG